MFISVNKRQSCETLYMYITALTSIWNTRVRVVRTVLAEQVGLR